MCTLTWIETAQGRELFFSRDERLTRGPEAPPSLWTAGTIPYLAPTDREAGGTWLGTNTAGLVAAITNRRGPEPRGQLRSRGLLVTDALAHEGAQAAAAWVQAHLADTAYAAFNLLLADGRDAFVVRHDPCEEGVPREGVLHPASTP